MQVNGLIFKELIKRGYSLEGNTRVWNIADSKLWYIAPEQAKAYLDLENAKDYSKAMFATELDMLAENMPKIAEQVLHGSSVNIIDIGCGDGKKAVPVINCLDDKTQLRYCPIDISSHMVTKAVEKITKLNKGEVVQFKWNISDFDNLQNVSSLLRDQEFRQNFFLFLGSTLSNFELHEIMYQITKSMDDQEDYLLLGVALSSMKPEDLIATYKTKFTDDFLSHVLLQLGFSRDQIQMDVRYRNSRVELFYTVLADKMIKFGDKTIYFMKGDQILVGVSHRYSEKGLKDALKLYFKSMRFYLNKEKNWALVLCKR